MPELNRADHMADTHVYTLRTAVTRLATDLPRTILSGDLQHVGAGLGTYRDPFDCKLVITTSPSPPVQPSTTCSGRNPKAGCLPAPDPACWSLAASTFPATECFDAADSDHGRDDSKLFRDGACGCPARG